MIFRNDLEGKVKNTINLEYCICHINQRAIKFLVKFKDILKKFETRVNFVPRVKFLDLKGKHSDEYLKTKCFAEGEFCSTSKDNPFESLIEGIR